MTMAKTRFRRNNLRAPADHKGAMAFHAGIPFEGNPYGGHEARAWARGWKDAAKRKKKEQAQ